MMFTHLACVRLMFETVFIIIRHSGTIVLSDHQANEQEVRVRLGEGNQKARLPWPVLSACSAPSSGRVQCNFRNQGAWFLNMFIRKKRILCPTSYMTRSQSLTVHLMWIMHILNYTQQIFNLTSSLT